MFKKIFFILLFFGISVGITKSEIVQEDYTISQDDILEITVYGEPDLSTTVRVAQDGTISYPLLGNIKVVDSTVRELENQLTELLGRDYLVNPQVKVFVTKYANITILGEVKNPGSYQMKENLVLTQAIALAGGFTSTAKTDSVKIIRVIDGKKEAVDVNFEQILEKALPDVTLKGNDTILVISYGQFSIMGQVVKPGVYNLKKGLTVVEAISLAGGFTPTAAQNAVKVNRKEKGKEVTIRVPVADIINSGDRNRDILVKENDTIVVPESFF
jgi:polysaccharide export outer membrane protein